jgi:hypothetical protein
MLADEPSVVCPPCWFLRRAFFVGARKVHSVRGEAGVVMTSVMGKEAVATLRQGSGTSIPVGDAAQEIPNRGLAM